MWCSGIYKQPIWTFVHSLLSIITNQIKRPSANQQQNSPPHPSCHLHPIQRCPILLLQSVILQLYRLPMIVNTTTPAPSRGRRPWLLLLLSLGAFLCPGCHCDDINEKLKGPVTLAELNDNFRCVKQNLDNLPGTLGNVMEIKEDGKKVGFNPKKDIEVYFAMLVTNKTLNYKFTFEKGITLPTPTPGVTRTCEDEILEHGSLNNGQECKIDDKKPKEEGAFWMTCDWDKVMTIEQAGDRVGSYYFTIGNLWTDSSYDNFPCPWRVEFDNSVFRLLVKTKDVEKSNDLLDKTQSIEECLDVSVASFFGCLFGSGLFLALFILAILLLLTLIGLIVLILLWKPKKKKRKASKSKGRSATRRGDTYQQHDWMRTKGVSEIHKPEGAHGARTTLMTTKPTGRTTGGGWATTGVGGGGKTGKTTGGGWWGRTFSGFTRPKTTGKTKQPTAATTGGGGRTKQYITGRGVAATTAGRPKQDTPRRRSVTVPDTGSVDPLKRGGGTTYEHLEQSNPQR